MTRMQGWRLYAVAVLYLAPVVALAGWSLHAQAVRSILAIALAALLLACLCAALSRTWKWFFLLQVPLVIAAFLFMVYTLQFGMPPGHTLAMLILGSSAEELRGFVGLPQGRQLLTATLLYAGSYVLLAATLPRLPIFSGRAYRVGRVLLLLAVPVTGYVATNPQQLIDGIALEPAVGSVVFLAGTLPQGRRELAGSKVTKTAFGAHRAGPEEVHVLVIGESSRRASWSAYGYRRATTPYLDALGDDCILLRDVRADANLTEWAVPILLTGITPERYADSTIRGNLLDLAREAGYSTAWLVNQDISISTSVGVAADRLVYPPDLQADINGRHTPDEALLPGYRRELQRGGAARFIGMHIMGSHWEYYRRYPPAFARFGDPQQLKGLTMLSVFLEDKAQEAAVVDAYDNSILYTDWFLHEVIAGAAQLQVPATVTFFPDHGESLQYLDDASGHGEPAYRAHAFEIPAFVWVNAAYRAAHPEIVAAVRANAGRRIRSHDLFQSAATLMGIGWPGADLRRSWASAQFQPDLTGRYAAGGRLVDPN